MHRKTRPIQPGRLFLGIVLAAAMVSAVVWLSFVPTDDSPAYLTRTVPTGMDSGSKQPDDTDFSRNKLGYLAKRGALNPALASPSQFTRYRALSSVARDLSPGMTSLLVDRSLHDPSPLIRSLSLRLLSVRKIEAILPVIISCLSDPAPEVQETALWILVKAQNRRAVGAIISAVDTGGPTHGQIRALGMLGGEESLEYLIEILNDDSSPKPAVCGALAAMGKPAADRLIRLIESSGSSERIRTYIDALAVFSPPANIQMMKRFIEHPKSEVRRYVAEAMGSMPSQETVNVLATALKTDPDVTVRIASAQSLGKIRLWESLIALSSDMESQPDEVRSAVRQSLAGLKLDLNAKTGSDSNR